MNLKDILAISGYSGLFRLISQAKNGIIVESITDKKRFPAFASHKVSALEDVAIFTKEGETPLKEILSRIFEKEKGGLALDPKKSGPDELRKYFLEVLPDYDAEKVYVSDIKKVLMWYNILHQAEMLNLPEEEKKEEEAVKEEEKAEDQKSPDSVKPGKKGTQKTKRKPAEK